MQQTPLKNHMFKVTNILRNNLINGQNQTILQNHYLTENRFKQKKAKSRGSLNSKSAYAYHKKDMQTLDLFSLTSIYNSKALVSKLKQAPTKRYWEKNR